MPSQAGARADGAVWTGGWALGWATAAMSLALAIPPGAPRAVTTFAVSAIAAAAAVAGLYMHRPANGLPWLCITAGLVTHALGDFADLSGIDGPIWQVVGRGADLATATLATAATVLFLLARHPDALLDAAVALLAGALLSTATPVAQALNGDRVFGAGLAAELVGLLVVGGLITVGSRGRPASLYLLLGAAIFAIAGSLFRLVPPGVPGALHWPDAPAMLAPVIAAAAVLHPSMRRVVEPVAPTEQGLGPVRLVVVGTALLISPVLHVAESVRSGGDLLAPVGFTLLTVLVLARIGVLLGERERIRAAYLDSEQRFRALVQHAFDVIAVLDASGVVQYVSPSAGRVLGRSPQACIGVRLPDLVAAGDAAVVQATVDAVSSNPTGVARVEVRLDQTDGEVRWGDVLLANRLTDPSVTGVVVNLRDVTERKKAELELSRLALHDPLTGLPNRVRLLERIAAVLDSGSSHAALLFCDLDGFKAVNDCHGHDLGDRLLIAVADRLREALRGEDEATRLGGDEFVVLCSGLISEAQVLAIAARLRARICEPFALRGVEIRIGCSIGIATADQAGARARGVRPQALLDAADRAMYRAKRLHAGIAVHRWDDQDTRPTTIDLTVRTGT